MFTDKSVTVLVVLVTTSLYYQTYTQTVSGLTTVFLKTCTVWTKAALVQHKQIGFEVWAVCRLMVWDPVSVLHQSCSHQTL